MAQADNESTTPYVSRGNRALISVTTEYAPERVRDWLAEPRMEAFGLDPATGREYIIPVELWRSDEAAEVLRTGKYRNLVIFVRDFDRPPDHVFMLPDERENFPPRRSPEPVEPAPAVPPIAESEPAKPVVSSSEAVELSGRRPKARAKRVLKERYPPDGIVPAGMTVAAVQGEINRLLAPETKLLGLADISWDTTARAIQELADEAAK